MHGAPILLTNTDWRHALLTNREQTLERIYAKVYPMALHYVKERGGSADDAKDIFQEALIVFYEKVVHDQLVLTASISTYLMAICKNLWLQELEKRARKTSLESLPPDIGALDSDEEIGSDTIQLKEFVNGLGDKCRDILVSFYYFGQKLEYIAAKYGYRNIHTATVQKFKCLERLRKAVSHLSIERFHL
ncbi:RNA polymerase sigma factor [Xanthocytophaga flava]|uniref:RNA polymerase sigma factor n=1 Tax=Xanthocytophaga flava TaxID=3048013 RepID=UPI0028D78825|nr:sigma-70 family RNA polymerase sigma factor [Xanthocytophaga flavus]MDJ1469456.1 sigma-70 family RNA polymerase sigma factor [Xanthocytophaga flavus]